MQIDLRKQWKLLKESELPLKEELLPNNQVVYLGKTTIYEIYIAKFIKGINSPRVYTLEDYKSGNLQPDQLIDKYYKKIVNGVTEASILWKKVHAKDNSFRLIFCEIEKNHIIEPNEGTTGSFGVHDYASKNTYLARNLVTSPDFASVIVHESAHQIWEDLPKEMQKLWIDNYNKFVADLPKEEKFIKLTSDKLEKIWNVWQENQDQNFYETIPKIINAYYENKLRVVTLRDNFIRKVNPIANDYAIKHHVSKIDAIKKIASDKKQFFDNLLNMSFPLSADEIRNINLEKGHAVSKYGTSNVDEHWAETIEKLSSSPNEVKPELKELAYKLLQV